MKICMKTIYCTTIFSLAIFLSSCSGKTENKITDYIISEKDIIPEGVAFDTETQTIFVSSTNKRKIVSITGDGKITDFIRESQDDIKSVIGMEVDAKTKSLWVVSSEAPQVLPLKNPGSRQWWSSVYQFNLPDGKLLKKYNLRKDTVFLNDITIADDGTAYITETVKGTIYKIAQGEDTLQVFLQPDPYTYANGICFADKPGILFVCCSEGIITINVSDKKYSLLPVAGNNKAHGIDGLSFNDNYFIAHQSTAVTRFYLNATRDTITSSDTLNTGKEFDSSTTGEVSGNNYYFIVNSQVRSGVDFKNRTIKPPDSLENVIIRKIKL